MLHVLGFLVWSFVRQFAYYSPALSLETRGNLTFLEGSAGPAIIDYLGGVPQLKVEVAEAMAYATTLRNNTLAHWSTSYAGAGGFVAKICFEDGVCWADKMFAGFRRTQYASYGEVVMCLVHEYCPNIPVPASKAWFSLRIAHHMTDWVEGRSLFERVIHGGSELYTPNATTFRIPIKVVNSLAQFVYNISTCPIPDDMRSAPVDGELKIH